jgi:hypothetical protein
MVKLRFEKWLEESRPGEDVEQIFTDAIRCYKAGVHRAALMFSYLAFATALRERLRLAEMPPGFPLDKWQRMRTKLNDEDYWEKEVFDATQCQNPVFFPISVDLREQIKFWRNRRNDCAHFKGSEIGSAHVEAFWSFVEGNLSRITVNGGMPALLTKIRQHYTLSRVRRGKDVTPLVAQIMSSVDTAELPEFWNRALPLVWPQYRSWLTEPSLDFIAKVFALQQAYITKSLTRFIKSDTDLLLDYLSHKPGFVTQLEYDETEVRNLWHAHLPRSSKALSIYSALLRAGMIPPEEVAEANARFYETVKDYDVTPIEHLTLQAHGFGKVVQIRAFATEAMHKYMWVQERAGLLGGIVEHYPLTPVVVKRLCLIFNKDSMSFALKASLNNLFKSNPQKKAEFLAIMATEGYTIPKHLHSLAEQAPDATSAAAPAPVSAPPGNADGAQVA